jgi:hypothetical protein
VTAAISAGGRMGDWDHDGLLLRIAVGLVALAAVYFLFFCRRCDFRIRVRGRQVECTGKFPRVQQQALSEFLLQDLSVRAPLTICGAHQGKRLVLWFRGRLNNGQKQRIRNFLISRV